MIFALYIKAFLKRKGEKRSQKKIDALIGFVQTKFIDEYHLSWKDDLGQEFADSIDVLDEKDWQYFEQNIHTIPSNDLADIAIHLFEKPIFHKLEDIVAKKILCWAFLYCDIEDSEHLSDEVWIRLGTSVDLELLLLEKILNRFEELRIFNTTVNPEYRAVHLEMNMNLIKEKIENTKLHEQNSKNDATNINSL